MVIERNTNEIIIRIPSFVNIDGIQNMIDYLTYKETTAKSEATTDDVIALVEEMKKNRWAKRRKILLDE